MTQRYAPADDVDPTSGEVLGRIEVLDLRVAYGMSRIFSTSPATYFVDVDRRAVMRLRGDGSGSAFDNRWNALVGVICYDVESAEGEPDLIRVGGRPIYWFDPDPAWPNHEWRLQRVVAGIVRVGEAEARDLRVRYCVGASYGPRRCGRPEHLAADCEECEGL